MTPGGFRWTRVDEAGGVRVACFSLEGGPLEPHELAGIALPAETRRGEGLVASGRGPVWLFARLAALGDEAAWVAIHEPRLSSNAGSAGVVVRSHGGGRPPVGSVIRFPARLLGPPRAGRIVVVLGPPHSGKSQLLGGFSKELAEGRRDLRWFVHELLPDGEGKWSRESEASTVSALRHKWPWTDRFVEWFESSVGGLRLEFDVAFLDMGGRWDRAAERIARAAGAAIVLTPASGGRTLQDEWSMRAEQAGCTVIARLVSDLGAPATRLERSGGLVSGVVAHLDRGRPAAAREAAAPALAACLELLGL